jgi:hypothetical protein
VSIPLLILTLRVGEYVPDIYFYYMDTVSHVHICCPYFFNTTHNSFTKFSMWMKGLHNYS